MKLFASAALGLLVCATIAAAQGSSPAPSAQAPAPTFTRDIAPLFYDRDRIGVPHQWIRVVKEAIKTISPAFSACRMMKEYTQQMYLPAAKQRTEKIALVEGEEIGKSK